MLNMKNALFVIPFLMLASTSFAQSFSKTIARFSGFLGISREIIC